MLNDLMTDTSPLVALLGLEAHVEGGWFKETWRTSGSTTPDGYPGPRTYATGIYFLLHPGERSRRHRVRSDEMWLWHSGGPLRLRIGGTDDDPSGAEAHLLGPAVESGERPQVLVPAGAWRARRHRTGAGDVRRRAGVRLRGLRDGRGGPCLTGPV